MPPQRKCWTTLVDLSAPSEFCVLFRFDEFWYIERERGERENEKMMKKIKTPLPLNC